MARSFDAAYEGIPPWDIGRPQPEFVRLAEAGEIAGSVLDVGCGTGEHAIYLAGLGHEVLGIDGAPRAIEKALAKARERESTANFKVADALDLSRLGRRFDTVIDSGLFHVFSDDERPRFVTSLAQVVRPGGRYIMMCFSEQQPGDWGPRRVTQAEIRTAFREGWSIEAIRPARFVASVGDGEAQAWLALIRRPVG